MVKAREHGSTFWGMIVFVFLTLVFVVLYYQEASKNDDNVRKAANAAIAQKTADDKWTADNQVHLALTDSVGYAGEATGKPDKAKIDAAIAEAKSTLPSLISLPYDAEMYSPTGEGGKIEIIGQGKTVITYMPKDDMNSIKTLEGVITQFPLAARRLAHDVGRAFKQIDDLRDELTQLKTQHEQAIADLQGTISSQNQQIAQNNATGQQAESDLRDQITGLTSQLESATAEPPAQPEDRRGRSPEPARPPVRDRGPRRLGPERRLRRRGHRPRQGRPAHARNDLHGPRS